MCSLIGVATAMAVIASCSYRDSQDSSATEVLGDALVTTTKPGTGEVGSITWALYRDPISIDPRTAGDYPEKTVTSLLCESLFAQQPDGSIVPGLATDLEYPNPKTAVLTIRQGVRFTDGSPMTSEDVAFSIERNRDPKGGGYWVPVLSRVDSVTATDASTVTLELNKPDYWLRSALSFQAGAVVSKAAVEAEGDKYGTPQGGAMCTGPYQLKEWRTGDVLSVERNDDYWNADVDPQVREIDFKGIPDESTLASALQTGEVDGSYLELPLSTLDQIKESGSVELHRGPSFLVDAFIVSDVDRGLLQDKRVRRALSLAFDRDSYISSLYRGTAQPSRALGSPGTWGYERSIFESAWNRLPTPTVDLKQAKALIEEAGARGKTIVVGMSNEINKLGTEANAFRSAAKSIGLNVELKSYSADAYGALFLDPAARAEVDGFFTTNFPSWADPGRLYASLGIPGAEQDYGGYHNEKVAALLERSRSTEDPKKRAELTVEAQEILAEDLPWIPIVAPDTVLALSSDLSGATVSSQHFFAPWANDLGGVE